MAELKKMELTSTSGSSINLEALYQICPSAFTEVRDEKTGQIERKINFTTLRELLGDNAYEGADEEYGFNWVGKRAAQQEAGRPINKTLRPCPEESVDWEHTQNLYIEGDNLDVLKLLQKSYLGAIKMIYIDPPYNTGNDFVYRDDFAMSKDDYDLEAGNVDELGNRYRRNTDSNLRFHSDWCSMIYERLVISRSLLSEDGIIFISIDDNEMVNLKKICDEVFGAENFKSISIVMNNRGGRDYGGIALQHDYILIYTKSAAGELNLIEERDKQFQYYDELGGFNLMELRNRNVRFNDQNRPNLCYPFFVNPNNVDSNGLMEIALEPHPGFIEVWPAKSNGIQTVWRWGKEEKSRKNLNSVIFGKRNQNGGYMIVQKYRKTTKMQRSIWDEKEFVNERGTEAVKLLFDGKSYFDYPKSVFTINRIIELGASDDCIVLDFFSGSSTTAQAVMERNISDMGNRKFIMVQIPEQLDENSDAREDGYNNICQVAQERIRRAGAKIKADNPKAKNLDTGFRVFKLDESNMEDVYFAPSALTQDRIAGLIDNVKQDRNDLDLLFGCMLDWGVQLSLPLSTSQVGGKTIHNVNDGELVACFADGINEDVINAIAELNPLRVVFRDSGFESAPLKINLFEMFKQKCGWSEENVADRVRII